MDLNRLRVGEWITAISGVVLLISLFLPWDDAMSGWEALSVTDILLGLVGVAAILLWFVTARAKNTAPGIAFDALLVPFALVMSIVLLIKVWAYDGTGAWLGLAATLGVLVGTLVAMRDERLSKSGQPTDQTGVPVDAPPAIEKLPAPPRA